MKSKKTTPKKAAKKVAAKKEVKTKKPRAPKGAKAAAKAAAATPIVAQVAKLVKNKAQTAPENVQEIELNKIIPGDNYRTKITDESVKELSDSIRAQGLIQPITLKEIEGKPGFYSIIAGERRYRASVLAGMKTIRSLFFNTDNTAHTRVVQLIENLQREDVNPMDEAIAFYDLTHVSETQKSAGQKKPDYTPDTLAAAIGKSRSYIFKRMKLRDLIQRGQDWFRAGWITYHHALVISRLEPKVQEEALLWIVNDRSGGENGKMIVKSVKTVEQLQSFLLETMAIEMDEAPFNLEDENLLEDVTSCAKCPLRTCNNKDLLEVPSGHFEEGEAIDKCTNKFCFSRKVDAHRQQRIDETTKENKGVPLPAGSIPYRFAMEVKTGGVNTRLADKKSKEYPDAVLITKQQQGSNRIGQVVYVNLDTAEKKKEIVSDAGGSRKAQQQHWEVENRRKELVNQYKNAAVADLTGKLMREDYAKDFTPAVSDDELIIAITSRLLDNPSGRAEGIALQVLKKLTGKKDEQVQLLLQEINTALEEADNDEGGTTQADIFKKEYPALVKALHGLKETQKLLILRLVLADMISSDYQTNPAVEPFYAIMKECGHVGPDKAEKEFVDKGMKPVVEATKEEEKKAKKPAAKQKDLLEEIEEMEGAGK